MRLQTLTCQNCAAPLRPLAGQSRVECDHCHQILFMPAAAPTPREPTVPRRRAGRAVGMVVTAGAVCAIGAAALAARKPSTSSSPPPAAAPVAAVPAAAPAPAPVPVAAPPPWREVLAVGAAGTGAGMFTHPHRLAVSPEGTIVVAERDTGRVHRFRADGTFENMITVAPSKLTRDVAIFGLAAGRDGVIWLNRGGDLVELAADGRVVRTVTGDYPETWFHGDVALDATGAVYAVTDRTGRLDVVKLVGGKQVARRQNAAARHLAVDGLGTLVVARDDDGVDVIAPDGELRARHGGAVRASAVVLDDAGRVYVSDGHAVQIFDAAGQPVVRLATPAHRDLALDAAGHLYLLGSDKVHKLELTLPAVSRAF